MDIMRLNEEVCANCPATKWGEGSSTCYAHGEHISKVKACREWDKYIMRVEGVQEDGGQLQFVNLTVPESMKAYADRLISRHSENLREYERLTSKLSLADAPKSTGVAKYGLEATLPRPKGLAIDSKVASEWERLQRVTKYLRDTENARERVVRVLSDKHNAILEQLLDGVQVKRMAEDMKVSRQTIYDYRAKIVEQMAVALVDLGVKAK